MFVMVRDTTNSITMPRYGLGTYCDPFGISYQQWVDDVSKWHFSRLPQYLYLLH